MLDIVDDEQHAARDQALQAEIRDGCLAQPMLTAADVGDLVTLPGIEPRDVPAALEQRGGLFGVTHPDSHERLYLAFQVDREGRQVHPVVARVNRALDATRNP